MIRFMNNYASRQNSVASKSIGDFPRVSINFPSQRVDQDLGIPWMCLGCFGVSDCPLIFVEDSPMTKVGFSVASLDCGCTLRIIQKPVWFIHNLPGACFITTFYRVLIYFKPPFVWLVGGLEHLLLFHILGI